MQKNSLLFVYGTLRLGASSDLSRNHLVEHVGEDFINGRLYNLGRFPGVKDVPESGAPQVVSGSKADPGHFDIGAPFIRGDVFKILDDTVVVHLDRYEGYPDLYNRHETESAEGRHVWVYTYNHAVQDSQEISSGDWIADQLKANPPANTAG